MIITLNKNKNKALCTFSERAHQCPKMVRLLEFADAYARDVLKILADVAQELATDVSLSCEEAV